MIPVIAVFKSAKGMPRFCETCRAAMNCPWFVKPAEAVLRLIPSGSIPLTFDERPGVEEIFLATGLSVVGEVVVGVVVVVPEVDVPVVVEVVVVGFVCGLPCELGVDGFDVVGAADPVAVFRCGLPPFAVGGFPLDALSGATPSDRAMMPMEIL